MRVSELRGAAPGISPPLGVTQWAPSASPAPSPQSPLALGILTHQRCRVCVLGIEGALALAIQQQGLSLSTGNQREGVQTLETVTENIHGPAELRDTPHPAWGESGA